MEVRGEGVRGEEVKGRGWRNRLAIAQIVTANAIPVVGVSKPK